MIVSVHYCFINFKSTVTDILEAEIMLPLKESLKNSDNARHREVNFHQLILNVLRVKNVCI